MLQTHREVSPDLVSMAACAATRNWPPGRRRRSSRGVVHALSIAPSPIELERWAKGGQPRLTPPHGRPAVWTVGGRREDVDLRLVTPRPERRRGLCGTARRGRAGGGVRSRCGPCRADLPRRVGGFLGCDDPRRGVASSRSPALHFRPTRRRPRRGAAIAGFLLVRGLTGDGAVRCLGQFLEAARAQQRRHHLGQRPFVVPQGSACALNAGGVKRDLDNDPTGAKIPCIEIYPPCFQALPCPSAVVSGNRTASLKLPVLGG